MRSAFLTRDYVGAPTHGAICYREKNWAISIAPVSAQSIIADKQAVVRERSSTGHEMGCCRKADRSFCGERFALSDAKAATKGDIERHVRILRP
jgi:hypothetical protein